jgi:hypothetical protein
VSNNTGLVVGDESAAKPDESLERPSLALAKDTISGVQPSQPEEVNKVALPPQPMAAIAAPLPSEPGRVEEAIPLEDMPVLADIVGEKVSHESTKKYVPPPIVIDSSEVESERIGEKGDSVVIPTERRKTKSWLHSDVCIT